MVGTFLMILWLKGESISTFSYEFNSMAACEKALEKSVATFNEAGSKSIFKGYQGTTGVCVSKD